MAISATGPSYADGLGTTTFNPFAAAAGRRPSKSELLAEGVQTAVANIQHVVPYDTRNLNPGGPRYRTLK